MEDEELNSTALTVLPPPDPSELGFPPSLPIELAARMRPVKEICQDYGLTKADYLALCENSVFIQACEEAVKTLAEPGGAFKAKAKTIAEALLPRMYRLATSENMRDVPAAVQADMIKAAIRVAGLDQSIDQKGAAAGKAAVTPLNIQINLR